MIAQLGVEHWGKGDSYSVGKILSVLSLRRLGLGIGRREICMRKVELGVGGGVSLVVVELWLLHVVGCDHGIVGGARDDVGGLHHRGGVRVGGACLEG